MKDFSNSKSEIKAYDLQSSHISEVSKRKSVVNESKPKEELFDTFFQSEMPIGIAIINNSLRYERVNKTLAQYHGLKAEEHKGKSIYEVIPQIAAELAAIVQNVLKTDEPIINLEIEGETGEYPGQMRYWLASYFPLHDINGLPYAVAAIIFDITKERVLENELQAGELKYRILSKNIEDAVLIFDNKAGKILYASPQTESLLGYNFAEMQVVNARDLVSKELSFDDGSKDWQRCELRARNGSFINAEVFAAKISDEQVQLIIRRNTNELAFNKESVLSSLPETQPKLNGKLKLLQDFAVALTAAADILEHVEKAEKLFQPNLEEKIDFYEQVSQFEINLIQQALAKTSGNQKRAAELLGIKNTTLNQMLKRYNLQPSELSKSTKM